MIDTLERFGKDYIFLPDATRGTVRGVTTSQLEQSGTVGLVANTLHLYIAPGIEKVKAMGGVKGMMDWNGLVLTDSGGFQVFSLLHLGKWKGKIDDDGARFRSPFTGEEYLLTPERSIEVQFALDSDVMVVLDDCRKADVGREEASRSVSLTLKWAERAKKRFEELQKEFPGKKRLLSAVVQGANFGDLRELCAKELVDIGFDGYNFGGYVLNDKGELVKDQLEIVATHTPDNAFRYAMGVGKPNDILEAAKLGYKVFDTVLPTRNARHGTLYSRDEHAMVLRIKGAAFADDNRPIDSRCGCEACSRYSRSYVHHLIRSNEITGMSLCTIHNLTFYQDLIKALNGLERVGADTQLAQLMV